MAELEHDHGPESYCTSSCPAHRPMRRPAWGSGPWRDQEQSVPATGELRAVSEPPPGADPQQAAATAEEERRSRLAGELEEWWTTQAQIEAEAVVLKAVDYSSYDLWDIGVSLARMAGRTVTEAEAVELGIAYYAQGKMARIMGALIEGRWPSEDSWADLGTYARMALRTREAGGWPNAHGS
jgi:hypothetical protein